MTPPYRYKRGVGNAIQKEPVGDTPLRAGEMVALPGKKHRTYRAPVRLDADNKPVQTSLHPVQPGPRMKPPRRKRSPKPTELELEIGALDAVIATLDRLT